MEVAKEEEKAKVEAKKPVPDVKHDTKAKSKHPLPKATQEKVLPVEKSQRSSRNKIVKSPKKDKKEQL